MCPDAFLPTPPQGGFPGINLVCARYNCNPSLLPYLVAALGASASWLGPGELLGRLAYLPLPLRKVRNLPTTGSSVSTTSTRVCLRTWQESCRHVPLLRQTQHSYKREHMSLKNCFLPGDDKGISTSNLLALHLRVFSA